MSGRTVYEYASIRLIPRVEREEFVNVGVILYCKKRRFVGVKIATDERRITALFPSVDMELVKNHLNSFERICAGDPNGGKLATMEMDERFRWLTANRSTIIQCSAVHPGQCLSAEETLDELFSKLVSV